MQSSGRQLLRQRHLKQDDNENEDGNGGDDGVEYDAITKRSDEVKTSERACDDDNGDDGEEAGIDTDKKDKENSKTADPTAAPTIGAADDDTNANATAPTVSRTVGDADGDDNTSSNSTQTTSTGTSQPTTAPTNTTTITTAAPSPTNSNSTSPSPTAAPTVETYDCYENNPCLDAAERQVYYYRHSDPTKFVQCGAAATCFTMSCHQGLVWSLEDAACVVPAASP